MARVALVTGGTRGIGASISKALKAAGRWQETAAQPGTQTEPGMQTEAGKQTGSTTQ